MDRNVLEELLKDKAVAPRITLQQVQDNISSVHYFSARQGVEGTYEGGVDDECVDDAQHLKLLTICTITAKNGFTFVGTSACAYPENFDAEIGKKIAYDRAFNKMWVPMGYMLKQAWADSQRNDPPQETNWQDRLKSEVHELHEKANKLAFFMLSDEYKALDGLNKQLLIQQKNAMNEYVEILEDRLKRI
jgi:hypothetical protein